MWLLLQTVVKVLNFVKQGGDFLDFINKHGEWLARVCLKDLGKDGRIFFQFQACAAFLQVEDSDILRCKALQES